MQQALRLRNLLSLYNTYTHARFQGIPRRNVDLGPRTISVARTGSPGKSVAVCTETRPYHTQELPLQGSVGSTSAVKSCLSTPDSTCIKHQAWPDTELFMLGLGGKGSTPPAGGLCARACTDSRKPNVMLQTGALLTESFVAVLLSSCAYSSHLLFNVVLPKD